MQGRKAKSPPGFMSTAEAAAFLGIHPGSLLRGVRDGNYPLTAHTRAEWRVRAKYYFRTIEVKSFKAYRDAQSD